MGEGASRDPWASDLARYRDAAVRAQGQVELLNAIDVERREGLEVRFGRELWLIPAGDSINEGWSLWIDTTPSGFSLKLQHKKALSAPRIVARGRAIPKEAPRKLGDLIDLMNENRGVSTALLREPWDQAIQRLQDYGGFQASKGNLLAALDPRWRPSFTVFDNEQRFGIIRNGDKQGDSYGVWIAILGHGWEMQLIAESPSEGRKIVRSEVVRVGDSAVDMLEQLLALIDNPQTDVTAQEAYKQFLRHHIAPFLRSAGYKGSGGKYHRRVGDYHVALQFQKSKWSSRDRVDYLINLYVQHPETAKIFNEGNNEARRLNREWEEAPAGNWHAQFPGWFGRGTPWISLRPSDDLRIHSARLEEELQTQGFPEIERQIRLPLVPPTPPIDRPPRPSGEEIAEQARLSTLQRLRQAGVEVE